MDEQVMIKEAEVGAVIIAILIGILVLIFFRNFTPPFPFSVVLQVPFTPQAPLGNWTRNEDCEETSIAMATAFLNGQTEDKMPVTDAQRAINQLKNWENINIGYNANTGANATTQMAEGAFELRVRQINNYSEEDLKKALISKEPVLLPINAKDLRNSHYINGGPLYHMILVRGYEGDEFIINDPGTDAGDGNRYSFSVLKAAAADWNQQTQSMNPNSKIALVLSQ